ncbi:hypothetical protein H0H92_009970 [Tricholoma furcatifolium]|nr:hypothetical protein H0H92_009970 [Tricholoma furcatifolium]
MVSHYLDFKYLAKSMRDLSRQSCTCGEPGRSIDVLVIHFDTIEQISLALCSCTPAPIQLLQRGCFASAPLEPTLAVDLKVLDFVTQLFLNIAPNHTAWAKSVKEFLGQQGYKLKTEDSLRKRFSNALLWYNSLQDLTVQHIDNLLEQKRHTVTQDGLNEEEGEEALDGPEPFSSPCIQRTHRDDEEFDGAAAICGSSDIVM